MSSPDGAAAARWIIDQAPDMTERDTWPEPDLRLVEDDQVPPPILDNDALPTGWGEGITSEAAARGCPRDYVAAGLIAAASAWIGNARHVGATAIWTEPPHLWLALIGTPSSGKSPALRPIDQASRAIERAAEPAWEAARAEYDELNEGARVIKEDWPNRLRAAAKAGEPAPERPPGTDAPTPPARLRVLAMDATTEELQNLMAEQPRGLLYMRDELAGWLGNHDRYGGHGGDRSFFLEAWNGGSYVADRVKYRGQPVRIARAALAILAGCNLIGSARRWPGRMAVWRRDWPTCGPTRPRSRRWPPSRTQMREPAATN
jgi:hypothetical protein